MDSADISGVVIVADITNNKGCHESIPKITAKNTRSKMLIDLQTGAVEVRLLGDGLICVVQTKEKLVIGGGWSLTFSYSCHAPTSS